MVSRVKILDRDRGLCSSCGFFLGFCFWLTLCPDCAQVGEALNVCGLGPESLRELFDALRVFGPSEVKAKMEALRGLGVQMDMQDRASLN